FYLGEVGHYLFVAGAFRAYYDYGHLLVDEGDGAVFHFAGGVAFGVDVGNLFELEGAFERNRVVVAAAEEEEVAGVAVAAGDDLDLWGVAYYVGHLVGNGHELADQRGGSFGGEGAGAAAQMNGDQYQCGELGGECLCGGYADLGAGVGVERMVAGARDRR